MSLEKREVLERMKESRRTADGREGVTGRRKILLKCRTIFDN